VLSSPSGAGKTSLARALLAADGDIRMSVSVTTRSPRPGEVEGRDYHFINEAEFDRRARAGDLLEWARVFDRGYGTPRAPVETALSQGRDVLFDIDWQGTQQLAARMPSDLVRVFILPPSVRALEERLKTRAQDPPDVVASRMSKAAGEISHWAEYDYVIVNDHFETSLAGLKSILAAERLKRVRLPGLADFVQGLVKGL
jgi:guanylate kinase